MVDRLLADRLLREYPILTEMQSDYQIRTLLHQLTDVIDHEVDGDVVELGCYQGTATVFFQRLLTAIAPERQLHVYDSFQGLPEKSKIDGTDYGYVQGSFGDVRSAFEQNLIAAKMLMPTIHQGWFAEIPDDEYPQPCAFAFFDGDFYSSITDSFSKMWRKMSPGGVIVVHDYKFPRLPGVKEACGDWFNMQTWRKYSTRVESEMLIVTFDGVV